MPGSMRRSTALLLSAGVETAPLLFAGDLPTKRRERDQLLRAAAASPYTVVLRIPDSHAKDDEIAEILGAQRRVLVGDGIVDHGWRAETLDASALDADALARPPHLMVIPATGSDPRAVIDGYVFAERLLDAGLSHRSVDELLEELGFGRTLLRFIVSSIRHVSRELSALVDALDATWSSLRSVCDELTPQEWLLPTECPGWTVRDQVAHVAAVENRLLGRPELPPSSRTTFRTSATTSAGSWSAASTRGGPERWSRSSRSSTT